MLASQSNDTVHLLSVFNRDLGLDDDALVRILGAPPKMLERWHAGLVAPGPLAADRIARLRDIHARLYRLYEAHDALDWLRAPNEALHWLSPVAALTAGDFAGVNAAIDALTDRTRRY